MYDKIKPAKVITISQQSAATKIKYPKVVSLTDKKAEAKINKAIRSLVHDLKEEGEQPDTSVNISYTIKVNRNGVLSLMIIMSFYMEHAAHPMTIQKALTFSTLTGDSYTFPELFRPDSYYKTRLTRYVKEYIKVEDITLIEEFKSVTDQQEYFLTDEFLYLFYQLYEYTPYAYGFLEIPVPYKLVMPMLSKNSPIRQLTSR